MVCLTLNRGYAVVAVCRRQRAAALVTTADLGAGIRRNGWTCSPDTAETPPLADGQPALDAWCATLEQGIRFGGG